MKLRGTAYTVISSVFFGILPIFVKFALNTGLKTNQIILIRFSFAALFLFLYLLPQKKDLRVSRKQFLVLVFCAVVGYMGMNLTLFIAYQLLGAGLATAIHFSYPLFVTVFSVLLYKEHLNPAKKTALLLSVGGVLLLSINGCGVTDIQGIFFAIFSAVLYAFYVVGIASRHLKELDSTVLTFYICLFSCISSLFLEVLGGNWVWNFTMHGIFYMVMVSIFCTAIALILFAKGVNMIGPTSASILSTLEPIVGIVASFLVLKEPLSWQIIFGSALVIASVMLIALQGGGDEVLP
jgi:drug/metabolite transporter (DMT)-like permease